MKWIKNKYKDTFDPKTCLSTLTNKMFKDVILKFCMEEGMPLLIEGIQNTVDPILYPILEK